jgi:hypothetical protein
MSVDPEHLRKHYASMSDDALLKVDRSDLVEVAQKCYDDELCRRELSSSKVDAPDWLDDAAEVISWAVSSGQTQSRAEDTREILDAAGIPCHLELTEAEEEEVHRDPKPTHWLRLMVPAKFSLQAASTLERDIYNQDFEDAWKAHLEQLSDDELASADPQVTFCGLFDRVERVTEAHREELERRGLIAE